MANYIVQDTSLAAVADAIRAKTGGGEALAFPAGFVEAVEGITGGGGSSSGGGGFRTNLAEIKKNIGVVVSITAEDVPEPEEITYAIHNGWYVGNGNTISTDDPAVNYSFPVEQGKTYTITMVEIGNRLRCGFTTTDPSTITPNYAANTVVSDYVDLTSNLTVGYVFSYTAKADGWYLVYVSNQNQAPKISIVVEG